LIKIVDKRNYDLIETGDFWLHRYSSANFLESMFKNNSLNIKFTRAINFEDPLEGWDIKNKGIRKAIEETIEFYNRVNDDGGKVEMAGIIFSFFANTTLEGSTEWIEKLNRFNINRKSTFISCWFKTDTLVEENIAMWRLYGNNEDGIRVSVKWSELREKLLISDKNLKVGFVDYDNFDTNNPFFSKDKSYKHENEFRILFSKNNADKDQFIKIDGINVKATARSKHNTDCFVHRLRNLGFVEDNNSKTGFVMGKSKLFYESKQVDWTEVLKILNQDIDRQ